MLQTLGTARPQLAGYVDGGTCSDPVTNKAINEAIRYVLIFGNWKYTVRRWRICTKNNTVTLPDGVERILRYTRDRTPARAFSMAYQYMDSGPGDLSSCMNQCSPHLADLGMSYPVFFDPPCDTDLRLIAFSTAAADEGLNLTIYGQDQYHADKAINGSRAISVPIHRYSGGTEGRIKNINSMTMALENVPHISQVIKPQTASYVTFYAYDPAARNMWFLSKYHPRETQPLYRRYKVLGPNFTNGAFVQALVKLGYVEAVEDNDPLIIQNVDALQAVIQAQKALRNDDTSRHNAHMERAVGILDRELANFQQSENEFDVQTQAWGWGIAQPR